MKKLSRIEEQLVTDETTRRFDLLFEVLYFERRAPKGLMFTSDPDKAV